MKNYMLAIQLYPFYQGTILLLEISFLNDIAQLLVEVDILKSNISTLMGINGFFYLVCFHFCFVICILPVLFSLLNIDIVISVLWGEQQWGYVLLFVCMFCFVFSMFLYLDFYVMLLYSCQYFLFVCLFVMYFLCFNFV